jgi:hypothetical protein
MRHEERHRKRETRELSNEAVLTPPQISPASENPANFDSYIGTRAIAIPNTDSEDGYDDIHPEDCSTPISDDYYPPTQDTDVGRDDLSVMQRMLPQDQFPGFDGVEYSAYPPTTRSISRQSTDLLSGDVTAKPLQFTYQTTQNTDHWPVLQEKWNDSMFDPNAIYLPLDSVVDIPKESTVGQTIQITHSDTSGDDDGTWQVSSAMVCNISQFQPLRSRSDLPISSPETRIAIKRLPSSISRLERS